MRSKIPVFLALFVTAWFAPRVASAADTKLCFRYPGSAYDDASPHFRDIGANCFSSCPSLPGATSTCSSGTCEYDFGEDKGFSTGLWKLRRAYVGIFADDSSLSYVGHLDSQGCTPNIDADDGPFTAMVFPSYQSAATDFRFRVDDCSTGTCTLPSEVIGNITPSSPPAAKTTTTLPVSELFSIYSAIAFSLDRLMGGFYGSGWHDFRVRYSPSFGNAVSWDDSLGQPIMTLGAADAGKSKFKPIHELGHILHVDAVEPANLAELQSFFVDCSYNGSGHTVFGREYSSCADVEGFAHYVAAATWNDLDPGADGVWVDWSSDGSDIFSGYSVYDIEIGTDELSSHCTGSSCCGYGVEMDWARMFWDFRTDVGTAPGTMDMLDVFADAYIWNTSSTTCVNGTQGSHFFGIASAVSSVLGSTLGYRFSNDASFNGANH